MKRSRIVLTTPLVIAALLGLAGCSPVSDASYTAVRDGAERALAATFAFSAGVANWLEETPEPREPACVLGLRG
ncbi:MAG TPA: hypothetical protein VHC97_16850 [Thermoanaerobaculia bacterium]|jgi:hypothetical protein|nr:hypothetical protein [Thermoanaerobaculia bacterium]